MVSARKKASPDRALMPLAMPSFSCEKESLTDALAFSVRFRSGRRLDPHVFEPALNRAPGVVELVLDVARLGGYAPDHHQEQPDAHRHQAGHDQDRANWPRDATMVQPGHHG